MHSCIYAGQVQHRRFGAIENRFTSRLFMMYLDLDELPTLFRRFWFWSASSPNIAWFRRKEHLGGATESLAESVRSLVKAKTGRQLNGPIRLLTHLRYFGFAMNPVSYYYCFDASGQHVECVVAEVNNTPWGEQHCYVVEDPQNRDSGKPEEKWTDKQFHVSPFMPMDMRYRWHLSLPGESLNVHIENHAQRSDHAFDRQFDVAMSLKRQPITSRTLAAAMFKYPIMTAQVFAGIYWQALRLWWKKVPFVPHPGAVVVSGNASKNVHLPGICPESPAQTK